MLFAEQADQNVYILFRDATTPTQGLPTITAANISGSIRRLGDPTNSVTIAAGDLVPYADGTASPHVAKGFWDDGQGVGVLGIPDTITARGRAGDANYMPSEILVHLDLTGTTEYQFHKSFPVVDMRNVFWKFVLQNWMNRNGLTIPEQCSYAAYLSLIQEVNGVTSPGSQELNDETGTPTWRATLTASGLNADVIVTREQFTKI